MFDMLAVCKGRSRMVYRCEDNLPHRNDESECDIFGDLDIVEADLALDSNWNPTSRR